MKNSGFRSTATSLEQKANGIQHYRKSTRTIFPDSNNNKKETKMSKNTSENGDLGREESKEADTAELTVSSLKFQTLMELER